MSDRDAFLARVRRAVAAGNQPGRGAAPGPRGSVGYQGAGPDPAARFRDELTAAGGHAHLVRDRPTAAARVIELARAKSPRRVLLGGGPVLAALALAGPLRALGVEVLAVDDLPPGRERDPLFAADLGITGADYLIAETGSLVVLARPDNPRSLSLLPPVHIAVADAGQILPDLFDLFTPERWGERPMLPSCVSLITGPSKTGDIELRLVTGVHGPGEVHVVLIDAPCRSGFPA